MQDLSDSEFTFFVYITFYTTLIPVHSIHSKIDSTRQRHIFGNIVASIVLVYIIY